MPLKPLEELFQPNTRVHVDLMGPFTSTSETGDTVTRYILVITDAFTKLAEVHAIPSKEADVVAHMIVKQWVFRYGVPKIILSDGGKEFCNKLAGAVWDALGVEHKTTSPYHPQTNGQAETFNRTIRRYITTALAADANTDWENVLPALMFSYNTSVHRATRMAPFSLVYGYEASTPIWDIDFMDNLPASTNSGDTIRN